MGNIGYLQLIPQNISLGTHADTKSPQKDVVDDVRMVTVPNAVRESFI